MMNVVAKDNVTANGGFGYERFLDTWAATEFPTSIPPPCSSSMAFAPQGTWLKL